MYDVGRAGDLLEQLAGQMGDGTGAGRSVGHLAGIGLDVSDQLFVVAGGHRGINRDGERRTRDNADGDEILDSVVGGIRNDGWIENLRARVAKQDRVAVRRGPRDLAGANHAAGAAPVFDHHGAKQRRHLVRPHATDNVANAAGGEWYD